jgi:hypothetical protein
MQDTLTMPIIEPEIIPALDPAVLEEVADDILLGAVRTEKVATVKAGHGLRGRNTALESRAWSFGGGVD